MFFISFLFKKIFALLVVSAVFFSLSAMEFSEDPLDPALEFTRYWVQRGQQERVALGEEKLEFEWHEVLDDTWSELNKALCVHDFYAIATLLKNREHYQSQSVKTWLREKALLGIVPCLHWYLEIIARKLAGKESLDVLSEHERLDLRFCIMLGIFRLQQDVNCFENVVEINRSAVACTLRAQWRAWFENFFKYEDDNQDLYRQTFVRIEEWFGQHGAELLAPTWLCSCSYSSIFREVLWIPVDKLCLKNLTHKKNQEKIQEVQAGVLLYNKSIFKSLTALHGIFSK